MNKERVKKQEEWWEKGEKEGKKIQPYSKSTEIRKGKNNEKVKITDCF